ncbi:MAG: hypothetical protein ACYCW6_10670 [Candidatus Xenobia bacterium]
MKRSELLGPGQEQVGEVRDPVHVAGDDQATADLIATRARHGDRYARQCVAGAVRNLDLHVADEVADAEIDIGRLDQELQNLHRGV